MFSLKLLTQTLTASLASATVALGWRNARIAIRPLKRIRDETSTISTSSVETKKSLKNNICLLNEILIEMLQ